MECRKPLYIVHDQPNQRSTAVVQSSSGMMMRSTMSNRPITRAVSPKPILPPQERQALPFSKNVVLIALMEVTRHQLLDLQRKNDNNTEAYRILDGIESQTCYCGTYIVKDFNGLEVHASDPRKNNDSIVKRIDFSDDSNKKLYQSQTVQIVDFEDGVFKVARNEGYIVANNTQLEKVDGPLDDSCRLEGMLNLAHERHSNLGERLKELEHISGGLSDKIEHIQQEEPSFPIFSEFQENSSDVDIQIVKEPVCRQPSDDDEEDLKKELRLVQKPTVVKDMPSIAPIFDRSRNVYVNSCILALEMAQNTFSCHSFGSFDGVCRSNENDYENSRRHRWHSRQSPIADFYASEITPLQNGNNYNESSINCPVVDFSTGLSGHRGLTGNQRKNQLYRRRVRFSSEHRGVNKFRGGKMGEISLYTTMEDNDYGMQEINKNRHSDFTVT